MLFVAPRSRAPTVRQMPKLSYSRPCGSVARTAIVGCGVCVPADSMSGG